MTTMDSIDGAASCDICTLMNRGRVAGGGEYAITQQLAKCVLNSGTIVYAKSEELFLSFELEKYSKDQILEMYLNNAYFGNGAYGIENASLRYSERAQGLTISKRLFLQEA